MVCTFFSLLSASGGIRVRAWGSGFESKVRAATVVYSSSSPVVLLALFFFSLSFSRRVFNDDDGREEEFFLLALGFGKFCCTLILQNPSFFWFWGLEPALEFGLQWKKWRFHKETVCMWSLFLRGRRISFKFSESCFLEQNNLICFMDLLDIASVASSLSSLREGYVRKHEACWVLFFLLPSPWNWWSRKRRAGLGVGYYGARSNPGGQEDREFEAV